MAAAEVEETTLVEADAPDEPERCPLPGPAKAALWLLSVEENLASEVLRRLDDRDLRIIRDVVDDAEKANADELTAVHHEFRRRLDSQIYHLRGSRAYFEDVARRSLGEARLARILGITGAASGDMSPLQSSDIGVLASGLRKQHPQIIAAIMSRLEPARGGELLAMFPDDLRCAVVGRLAQLSTVPDAVIERVEAELAAVLPESGKEEEVVDGTRVAAGILNGLDPEASQNILDELKRAHGGIADAIREAMLTFEDLVSLDKRGLQTLLKEVDGQVLSSALKGAPGALRESVYASMSKRAADMLQEELESMGPLRLSDVEKAQREIVEKARELQEQGRLALSGGGGGEFV